MYVMGMKTNENLLICFGMEGKPPEPCGGTWQFVLRPQSDGTTRLVLRARNPGEPGFGAQAGKLFDVITFTMQRGMLLGFRDRIEAVR